MIDLKELRRLATLMRYGSWKVSDRDDRYITDESGKRELARVSMRYKPYEERAKYIAAACNAVPLLLDERRALQERIIELESELEVYKEQSQLEEERRLDER